MTAAPDVTVVVAPAQDGERVRTLLESLCHQALVRAAYDVVVVATDDGAVGQVVRGFEPRLPVQALALPGGGVAQARNRGLSAARGEVVLFLEDRVAADPGLVLAHREAHRRALAPEAAVLGLERLSPALARDPLLHFAAERACLLRAFPYAREGEELDFTFLWPGCCSLKRAVLEERGAFDPRFTVGDDHAELGFRLGLRPIHVPRAVTTRVHGFDLDGLLGHLGDEGRSRWLLARLHGARAAQDAAGVAEARELWRRAGPAWEAVLRSARSLDALARASLADGEALSPEEVALLHRSYHAVLTLARARGVAAAAAEAGEDLAAEQPRGRPRAPQGAGGPRVSVVVPVFNQVDYTARCLSAIARNTAPGTYEVVVVDDASTDGTPALLAAQAPPVRGVRNAANGGFIDSCNRGAREARGEWLLFLNNDTEVHPGWLDALLRLGDSAPDVGAVGAQLVYPDGTLQEAGGIVFRDGSGWNFGRHDAPRRIQYQRPCEVDYCSGAALMVRRELFERLGGFDPRYRPAYFEDTDLCFGVRSLGWKVMYCPEAVVTHFEGVSNGTDTAGTGLKRHQVVNGLRFAAKWREALARHEESPAVSGRPPVSADRRRRLTEALVDRASPCLAPAGGA